MTQSTDRNLPAEWRELGRFLREDWPVLQKRQAEHQLALDASLARFRSSMRERRERRAAKQE
jgi:hypothetical protein